MIHYWQDGKPLCGRGAYRVGVLPKIGQVDCGECLVCIDRILELGIGRVIKTGVLKITKAPNLKRNKLSFRLRKSFVENLITTVGSKGWELKARHNIWRGDVFCHTWWHPPSQIEINVSGSSILYFKIPGLEVLDILDFQVHSEYDLNQAWFSKMSGAIDWA